jgi:hypothetical protein
VGELRPKVGSGYPSHGPNRLDHKAPAAMQIGICVIEDGRTRGFFAIVNCGNVVMRKDDVHFHVFVRESCIPEWALAKLGTERRVRVARDKYVELKGTLGSNRFSRQRDIRHRGSFDQLGLRDSRLLELSFDIARHFSARLQDRRTETPHVRTWMHAALSCISEGWRRNSCNAAARFSSRDRLDDY